MTAIENLEVKLAKVQVKGYLRKSKSGKIMPVVGHERFLGNDKNGNNIEIGKRAKIEAGPDKGQSGTVRGLSKGGGIQIEVGSGMQKRTILADPDELRILSR